MLRECGALVGVRPRSDPAHASPVIGYTTQRDAILRCHASSPNLHSTALVHAAYYDGGSMPNHRTTLPTE